MKTKQPENFIFQVKSIKKNTIFKSLFCDNWGSEGKGQDKKQYSFFKYKGDKKHDCIVKKTSHFVNINMCLKNY